MSKFKVGDRVRVVKASLPTYWYAGAIGNEYTLKEKDSFYEDRWYIDKLPTFLLLEEDIELVKEEKPMKKTETELMMEIAKLQQELADLRSREISCTLLETEWEKVLETMDHFGDSNIHTKLKNQIGE